MKRITAIEIENYRAFLGKYDSVFLEEGQNLLIYGENGSGKSSFYKAISNFFTSSRSAILHFQKNHFQTLLPGHVKLTFHDFGVNTGKRTSAIGEVITFGSDASDTDTSEFVKTTELVRGFLDYRKLLDVYYHKEPKPNLFQLIVIDLLENYIPPGGTYSLGKKWLELYNSSRDVLRRTMIKHQRALEELPMYEGALRAALDPIFSQLNALLIKYFKLNTRVKYILQPMLPYNYEPDWGPTADLRLQIELNGVIIENQGEFLNEARLAALSICLYLSALMRNPQLLDYKILYLDDVFIGLDTGNRIPVLNILKNHFSDYQLFISTYDRHWYELSKSYFEISDPGRWSFAEFYVGNDFIENTRCEKPIVVVSDTYYEKAIKYLHDRAKPDYPAAANYFRKALEEILQKFIPPWELADEDNTQLPQYLLGAIANRTNRFLTKTGNSPDTFTKIHALLPTLLHSFSHHNVLSPIYKKELVIIQTEIPKLIAELSFLDIPNNYKCSILAGRDKIQIKYVISAATGHFSYYELRTLEPITLKRNAGGLPTISKVHCVAERCWGENNGILVVGSRKQFSNEEKATAPFNFDSLEDAFDRIHATIINFPAVGNFAKNANYINALKYLDGAGVFQPLSNAIVW